MSVASASSPIEQRQAAPLSNRGSILRHINGDLFAATVSLMPRLMARPARSVALQMANYQLMTNS
jgi:hypothetical protein